MKFPAHVIHSIFFEIIEKAATVRKASGKTVLRGRCPICGDSKNKYKTRFYCLENQNHWVVYCHNCGYEKSFLGFLQENYPEKADGLSLQCFEMIKSGQAFSKRSYDKEEVKIKPNQKIHDYLTKFFNEKCIKLTEPQIEPNKEKFRLYALKKMKDRHIPQFYINQFFFCYKGLYNWRVIIPFIDSQGLYYNFQARDIHPNPDIYRKNKKYIFASFKDIDLPSDKIYRQHQVVKSRPVYICEGIIDCMHIENAIALCNANVTGDKSDFIRKEYPQRVWILDSPWRDQTGYERTLKLLEMGERCFIVPQKVNNKDVKDINDIAIATDQDIILHDFIEQNTIQGMVALMKLKTYKIGKKA
jgi:hypothetical protein